MPKRIRLGRKFWAQLVEEFEEAGATEGHQEFTDRHKVRCDSFRRWLYRLRAEKQRRPLQGSRARRNGKVAASLVEVQGVQVADSRFEIELPSGRRLRVPVSFDEDALRRLLGLFAETSS